MSESEKVQEHRSVESFELDGRWCTPCSCGCRFTGNSPSLAYGRWRKHAAETAPAAPVETRTPPPARVRDCGCGCGQPLAPRAGGLFRSGHDARFKSILTTAHAAGQPVRHPATDVESDPLDVADWLDERRGSGTFWRDKVVAGHRPAPERKPRAPRAPGEGTQLRGVARVDALMEAMATRRPVPGDLGVVTLRSGQTYGARVLRRANETALAVQLLEGPRVAEQIVVGDAKFTRAGR